MLKHLRQKYTNITTDPIELFKSYCVVCQEKRKRPKTTVVVVKPIISSKFNSCGQVDLVDMILKLILKLIIGFSDCYSIIVIIYE